MEPTQINYYYENKSFKPFPEGNHLERDIDTQYLLPVALWNLDAPRTDVLIALPIGDDEGIIAKEAIKGVCDAYWLTYSRTASGRWKLDSPIDALHDTKYIHNDVMTSFQKRKRFFQENKFQQVCQPEIPNLEYKTRLYSIPDFIRKNSNWFHRVCEGIHTESCSLYNPEQPYSNDEEVTLFDRSGKPYRFLCCINSYSFSASLTHMLYVFYSLETDTVLTICEYT